VLALLTHTSGIRTMMWILLAQQCGALLLVAILTLPAMSISQVRLLPRSAVREMLGYSLRVQAFALSGLINLQADAFIVGAVLPVKYVGLFGIGSSIATQIRSVPVNASGPLVARLTTTLGASGDAAAAQEFARLQRIWAVWTSAFVGVTVGVVGFCMHAWLGSRFTPAAIVATILLAGAGLNLFTIPLSLYLQAIGRPQIEVRYGIVSAGLNLVLTAALLWTGLYGISAATAAGIGVGSLLFVPLARAGVSRDLPGFLEGAAWKPGIAAAIASAAIAFSISAALPGHGVIGLVVTGFAVIPGACVFVTVLLGPRCVGETAHDAVRRRSVAPWMAAITAQATRS
jgi:O-antigen/teichoic acid export membrane protein